MILCHVKETTTTIRVTQLIELVIEGVTKGQNTNYQIIWYV